MSHQSSCLCGAVKITATTINPRFSVCHCSDCRTWGGAPFFAVQCGPDVTIAGEDKVSTYQSSAWAERGFCSVCGTHLFYRLRESGDYNMPVGLFADLAGLEMEIQYFSDQRPEYYCFSNQSKEMTRAEIMKHFGVE